jgi:hypothetical protein
MPVIDKATIHGRPQTTISNRAHQVCVPTTTHVAVDVPFVAVQIYSFAFVTSISKPPSAT